MSQRSLGTKPKASTQILPAVDLYTEDDKQLVAEFHAPSFTKDDIDCECSRRLFRD